MVRRTKRQKELSQEEKRALVSELDRLRHALNQKTAKLIIKSDDYKWCDRLARRLRIDAELIADEPIELRKPVHTISAPVPQLGTVIKPFEPPGRVILNHRRRATVLMFVLVWPNGATVSFRYPRHREPLPEQGEFADREQAEKWAKRIAAFVRDFRSNSD